MFGDNAVNNNRKKAFLSFHVLNEQKSMTVQPTPIYKKNSSNVKLSKKNKNDKMKNNAGTIMVGVVIGVVVFVARVIHAKVEYIKYKM